ncbi:NADH-quinone oxidoreductase subunit C [Streptomyces sp. NPDC020719]|uniref:NADH-quinone oxidoreductase subunit C n=1 Tax=Streptomyces sp. NPDC020719 TaxID=3154896 RepID=UPI0034026419
MTTTAYDRLPDAVTEIFGEEATAEEAYGLLTVDVPVGSWIAALEIARDKLGCTYFDWLSAVDEPGTGFRVCAHVVALEGRRVRRLLVRTTVPHTAPVLASAVDVYAGAAWHERETHEMFGVDFEGHPNLIPLLLPEGFEGHPLRKDFVLAARVAKAWPGAKEPGESDHGGPKRRQMLPPGVPDPNEWGPLKGQLPPAPARTPRAAGDRPARTPRAAGDRPVRRTRTVAEGSASQATPGAGTQGAAEGAPAPAAPEATTPPVADAPTPSPRRTRSASDGSASQTPDAGASAAPEAGAPPRTPRRSRSAADGSASQAQPSTRPEATPPPRTRSTDAPWNNPRPAFDEPPATPGPPDTEAEAGTVPEAEPAHPVGPAEPPASESAAPESAAPESERAPESDSRAKPEPETGAEPETEAEAQPGPEAKPTADPDDHDNPAGGETA